MPVPEKQLLEFAGVIDSSDTALIDRVEQVVDVAGEIIRQLPQVRIMALAGNARQQNLRQSGNIGDSIREIRKSRQSSGKFK